MLIADIELSSRVNRTLMNEFDHRSFFIAENFRPERGFDLDLCDAG